MQLDLARAMREAAELTRSQKLADATRVIQETLSGRREATDPPSSGEAHLPTVLPSQNLLESKPLGIEGISNHERFFGKAALRPKWSLGDVVGTLARAKRLASTRLRPAMSRAGAAAIPEGAQFAPRSFTGANGNRVYKLYLPANRQLPGLPLVTMLHGCTQNPDDFATGTRMNVLAEEFGFVVAYPRQPATANPSSCWNWFDPKHQMRGQGEPAIIAGIAEEIVTEYRLDRNRLFVAGLSAGGAMAAVMAATYPDVFSAIGVHSGLAYGSASDAMSAFAAMRGENPSRTATTCSLPVPPRIIVFHGDADRTVHPKNGDRLVHPSRRPDDHMAIERGTAGGRSFTRTVISDSARKRLAEHWLVEGAGHAWSGGNADGTYADDAGPDASREMVRFFLEP